MAKHKKEKKDHIVAPKGLRQSGKKHAKKGAKVMHKGKHIFGR